jgi:hypothetical protein
MEVETDHVELRSSGETLNSRSMRSRCTECWPCKKMKCVSCRKRRREFFVRCGIIFSHQWCHTTHLVISWPWNSEVRNSWDVVVNSMDVLSKFMSGRKVGPYLRVTSVGPDGCPHVHFLVADITCEKIKRIVSQKWPAIATKVNSSQIHDFEGILGYFFDQNYIPSQNDPDRIKGIRLTSATRPMPCGFPTHKQERQIRIIENDFLGKLPLAPEDFKKITNWNGNESSHLSGENN